MQETELYYAHPVQVRYWDTGRVAYVGGIAFKDYIICACCGKQCSIAQILDEALTFDGKDADSAIIELDWVNISNHIIEGK